MVVSCFPTSRPEGPSQKELALTQLALVSLVREYPHNSYGQTIWYVYVPPFLDPEIPIEEICVCVFLNEYKLENRT